MAETNYENGAIDVLCSVLDAYGIEHSASDSCNDDIDDDYDYD